jgi:signal transduction histidine kinase
MGAVRRLWRSTVARFVVLAVVLQVLVGGGLVLFVSGASQRALARDQQEWIDELQLDLLDAFRAGQRRGLEREIAASLQSDRADIAVILLTARDGTRIAGNLDAWPPTIPHRADQRVIDLYRSGADRPSRMRISAVPLSDGSTLLVGRVIDASVRLTQVYEGAAISALAIGLLLTIASALLLAQLLSRRVNRIVATADAVRHGAIGTRVTMNRSGDAFDRLGHAINAMLDRIEGLVSELRLTTDGLAHDLKSPLTRLRSGIERAMIETDDPAALGALERAGGEAQMLLDMLTTALLISRTQAGIGRDQMQDADVDMLLTDIAEIYGPLAEDAGFALEVEAAPRATIRLHRELVSQAIGNLIENALRYAAGGTRITLSGEIADGGHASLTVADDGPGIPADRHAEAITRFGRLDPSRHSAGSGLGLSLVDAVARLHGGRLILGDNLPGLRATIEMEPGG